MEDCSEGPHIRSIVQGFAHSFAGGRTAAACLTRAATPVRSPSVTRSKTRRMCEPLSPLHGHRRKRRIAAPSRCRPYARSPGPRPTMHDGGLATVEAKRRLSRGTSRWRREGPIAERSIPEREGRPREVSGRHEGGPVGRRRWAPSFRGGFGPVCRIPVVKKRDTKRPCL